LAYPVQLVKSLKMFVRWLTVHHTTRALFHASTLRPASQAGPLRNPRLGQLANIALLSLTRRVWVHVALPSSRTNSSVPLVGRPNRVTREAGRVGLMGKVRGRREYWVTLYLNYLYCLAWSHCFSRRLIETCMVGERRRQPLSTPRAVGPDRT